MKTTMMVILAGASVALSLSAFGEDAKPLTVEQVIGIGNVLRGFSVRQDAQGNVTPLPPGTYKFGGRFMMQLAVMQQQTDVVKRAYDDVIQAAVKDAFGDEAPKVVAADPKRTDEFEEKNRRFQEIVKKALASPAGVAIGRVREADLCLDAKPPACPIANPISIETVTLLLPVIDRDGQ